LAASTLNAVNALQKSNVPKVPMLVTLFGMVTLVRAAQRQKA
jgi:hypothetical protein